MNENQKAEVTDALGILEYFDENMGLRIEAALLRILSKPERGYFFVKNGAIYSDLSEKTLRRFISSGRLKAYRPARGKILVKKKELDALIEQSTKPLRKGRGIRR